ncbi:MAG: hypothetical protein V4596_04290 [Bdellovibrionota bacterium]
MNTFFTALITLFTAVSFAQKSQNVTTFENIKNTQIDIQCLNIDIKVIHDGSTPHLKVGTQVFDGTKANTDTDWNISVQKDAIKETIKVICNYPSKVFVDKKLETQYRYYMILRGPSTELNINSRVGKVSINGWKQATHVVLENGSVSLENTAAPFKVNMVKGNLDVTKHSGRLKADVFDGKLIFSGVEGNLDVTNFNGNSSLKGVNGDVNLNSKSGTTTVEGSSGTLKFDADQGKLDLVSFQGAIEGVSDQAIITAKLTNPARFKATIKNANIKLSVPSSSGAQVYFALSEGQFQAPSYLNKDEYGATKTLKGTLRGGESGRISITGEAGRVNLNTF